jgi:hypothetical protein
MIQFTVDQLLNKITLADLLSQEKESGKVLEHILDRTNSDVSVK